MSDDEFGFPGNEDVMEDENDEVDDKQIAEYLEDAIQHVKAIRVSKNGREETRQRADGHVALGMVAYENMAEVQYMHTMSMAPHSYITTVALRTLTDDDYVMEKICGPAMNAIEGHILGIESEVIQPLKQIKVQHSWWRDMQKKEQHLGNVRLFLVECDSVAMVILGNEFVEEIEEDASLSMEVDLDTSTGEKMQEDMHKVKVEVDALLAEAKRNEASNDFLGKMTKLMRDMTGPKGVLRMEFAIDGVVSNAPPMKVELKDAPLPRNVVAFSL